MKSGDASRGISHKTALGGVFAALTICLLYLGSLLPSVRLTLLCLSSVLSSVAVIESGSAYAFLVYCASAAAGFFLLPDKFMALMYTGFFGYYSILKYWVERLQKLWLEWILKLLLFNFIAICGWYVAHRFFDLAVSPIGLTNIMGITWLLFNVLFIVCDYALSLTIGYYQRKIRAAFWNK